MDTNRDGMDIDCCQDVKISNCSINSPLDDAIVLKSSYGLGFARPTKDVMITNCEVSGFEEGSFLDKTYKKMTAEDLQAESKWAQNPMEVFKISPFPIAYLIIAAGLLWKLWMAHCLRMSR
jgi:hypothetical protein